MDRKVSSGNSSLIVATATQTRRRKHLEAAIRQSAQTMSANLKTLHDEALYKSTHGTWEAYCLDVWGIGRSHAYRLLKHGKILALLGDTSQSPQSPIGDKNTPASQAAIPEAATRVVADLPDDRAVEVLSVAVETAPGNNGQKQVTAAHVAETRQQLEGDESLAGTIGPAESTPSTAAGRTIPERLQPAFATAKALRSLAAKAQSLVTEAQKLADATGGELIWMSQVRITAKDLKAAILVGACEVVCPYCTGNGCDECGQLGWMNKDRYAGLPREDK